jgi:regulator of protease activity HflC (stomatin/prohibitin superfamily)
MPRHGSASAEAEANATRMVSEAIAAGDVQAINYFVANNYIKALESLAKSPNQKVLMLPPVEAANVISASGYGGSLQRCC